MTVDLKLKGLPEDRTIQMEKQGSWPKACHIFDQKHWWAIRTAYGACRPLLVTGDPGLGKSQLARAAAQHLGRAFLPFVVQARSEATDLLYTFDAVARLAKAQVLGLQQKGVTESDIDIDQALAESKFTAPGPLWWALNWQKAKDVLNVDHPGVWLEPTFNDKRKKFKPENGCVVLIDEIDKADSDLPNGLLEVLGNGGFSIPLLGEEVFHEEPQKPPLIIITTNQERELPAAFIRRCVVLPLELPEGEDALIADLVQKGKAHFGLQTSEEALGTAAKQLHSDRKEATTHGWVKPGLAEYLDLIRALIAIEPEEINEHQGLIKEIASYVFKKKRRYD
jgi:MoxR-like ATPase